MKFAEAAVFGINRATSPVTRFVISFRRPIGWLLLFLSGLCLPLVFVGSLIEPTGALALALLWLVLFIPIFSKVFGLELFTALMGLRKELGILMGVLAVVHSAAYFVAPAVKGTAVETYVSQAQTAVFWTWFGHRGPPPGMSSGSGGTIGNSAMPPRSTSNLAELNKSSPIPIWEKGFWMGQNGATYLSFGFVATVFAFLLLVTSNTVSMKIMGYRRWKLLHRTAYVLLVFTVLHVVVLGYAKRGEIEFWPVVLLAAYFLGKTLEWKGFAFAKKAG